MERNFKSIRKCSQHQQTNTENHYQDTRIPPPPAYQREALPTKQREGKEKYKGKARNHELSTKICTRQMQKHEEQQQTEAQDKYRPCKEESHCKFLPHGCPSLSIELLSHVPSYLNNSYKPHPRHAHHLPPLSSKYDKERKPDYVGADGDRVLYKNTKFSMDSSVNRSCSSERSTKCLAKDLKMSKKSDCFQTKDSSPLVKSAREHCRQINARFKAKYSDKNEQRSECDSLGDTRKTLISGKSAGDLRSVVRSQIQVQELIDQSKRKFRKATEKRLDTLSSLSEFSINSRPQEMESKVNKLDNSQHIDVKQGQLMLSVSVEEMVSTKLIAPVVRKVQRMYLGTLREEMSIIEDLERLPCQVSSVFQTADEQKKQNYK